MIKHTIRCKKSGTREVLLTPLKALRFFCIECMGFSAFEVKKCTSPLCQLFPFRQGKVPGHKGKGNANNLIEK